jgi:iron complex outermembrane receptor protein
MARFNANTHFAPEQLNGYELGVRRKLTKTLGLGIATFYNHYHDLFDEEFTGPIFQEDNPPPTHLLLPAQFGNGLLGITKGIEISSTWSPVSFWRLRGSYSYLHMSIWKAPHSGDVGTGPGIVGASPGHESTILSSFDLSKTLQMDLTYRFVSALPAQAVPAYSTGDARFAWRFTRRCELSLVGRNLFQPSHPEYAGDPGPLVGIKRSAYIKLAWGM